MDGPADCGSFSLGYRAALFVTRSRLHLRGSVPSASWGNGNPRSADSAEKPLAEPLCGAFHRLPATRVPGPHHGLQRIFLAAYSESLLRVLRTLTDPSGVGERRARIESDSTSRGWYCGRATAGRRAASSL